MKYAIFGRDPRAQLLVDDSVRSRAALVQAIAEIREDIAAELPRFRASGKARGARTAERGVSRGPGGEGRVRLAFTPDRPPAGRTCWGLD